MTPVQSAASERVLGGPHLRFDASAPRLSPVAQAGLAAGRDLMFEVVRIRYWQHLMNEHLKQKRFKIPIHLSIGHEAIAVAVNHMMGEEDQLVLTHRNISYQLARAGSLEPLYREYLLQPDGASGGVLGSMNLSQPSRGIVYTSSILGNNLPVACGLALAQDVLQRRALVTVLTGDGAMEEGTFYEGLGFAKSHRLALLFLVENNDQSMSSTIAERRCAIRLADFCASFDVPYRSLSGNDVVDYASVLCGMRMTILDKRTPACIEAPVRAFCQHAGSTPGWPTDLKRINLEDGLLVETSADDPLFVIREKLGAELFDDLCKQAMGVS